MIAIKFKNKEDAGWVAGMLFSVGTMSNSKNFYLTEGGRELCFKLHEQMIKQLEKGRKKNEL